MWRLDFYGETARFTALLIRTTGSIRFHPVFTGGPHNLYSSQLASTEECQRMARTQNVRRVRMGLTGIHYDDDFDL